MKRYHTIITAGILVIGLSCTNPFGTREAEVPDLNGERPPSSGSLQSTPDSILSKIRQTFLTKDTRAYRECFQDANFDNPAFRFLPESDDAPRLIGWSIADEENYITNLVGPEVERVTLTPSNQIVTRLSTSSQDTVIIDFDYTITVRFQAVATGPEKYGGRGIIRVLRPQSGFSLYYIYDWEDFKSDSTGVNGTWSSLKARYR